MFRVKLSNDSLEIIKTPEDYSKINTVDAPWFSGWKKNPVFEETVNDAVVFASICWSYGVRCEGVDKGPLYNEGGRGAGGGGRAAAEKL